MSESLRKKGVIAAKAAAQAARILLNASESIPYFGTIAQLINKLIEVCDQCKCNKEASQALQERFCRLSEHLFSGTQGLAVLASSRPNNAAIAVFCDRMKSILQTGISELNRFTKGGFIMSILKGSKPQETFESLDGDMTQCLNELSAVLHVTALNEQAQMYDVVCNIQAKVDKRGGLEGLMADPVQLESLAQEIGADVGDLKAEVLHVLASLGTQVSVVDENVKEMKAKVDAVHQAVVQMQKATAAPDMTALQLTSPPVVDRTQVLGEGAFGKVYKGVYNHMDVAVKEVSITAAQDKEFLHEVAMHYKVGNLPGVVRLFGANFNTQPRCIVLELAAGTLHDSIHKGRPEIDRALPSKLSLLAQVCTTMAAISDMGILHRDLKSSNVLLFFHNERVYAKISDFGLTKMANESTISSAGASPKGTLPYMAPELFRGQYSSASDMYAFAVLLNEVLTEQVPFPGRSYVEIVQSVGTYRHRPDRYKADATDTLGCELMRCTERCWHQDPALRMSFHELAAELNHLLRKAAEAARVGNQASPLTPPRPPTKEIEDSITALVDWLTSSCHLAETDAMPLAHTLVTVKRITSVPVLEQVMQRAPDFLSRELNVSAVHDAKICTTLGLHFKSPTVSACVHLESLSSAELCQLFHHCSLVDLNDFIHRNKLKGIHLKDAVESVQDLVDLGLDLMTARVVFKRITKWKENGLPEDFHPTQSPSLSVVTAVAETPTTAPAESAETSPHSAPQDDSALPLSAEKSPVPLGTSTSVPTENTVTVYSDADTDAEIEKQLDADYTAAVHCGDRAAVDRLIAAGKAGNYLALAYLSFSRYTCDVFGVNAPQAGEFSGKALPWLTANAARRNKFALFSSTMCLYYGQGMPRNNEEARKYIVLAADQGHAESQFTLANWFLYGYRIVTKDEAEAVRYYKLAVDQNHAGAEYRLGELYRLGIGGLAKDDKEAARYHKLAADQGHVDAQYHLGVFYYDGTGLTRDYPEAARYHKLAADQGHELSLFKMVEYYQFGKGVGKNEVEAAKYYKLAAARGSTRVLRLVGACYFYGYGVPKDEIEGAMYYKLAADKGHGYALYDLAMCYSNGTGVNKDEKEAVRLYTLAAYQNLEEAEYKLGVCFANGIGVEKDEKEAAKYFKLAADRSHKDAMINIAMCYANGIGVTKDEAEAVKYHLKLVDRNYPQAEYHLGLYYAKGTGVGKDKKLAVMYYTKAVEQGNIDAMYSLGTCYALGKGVNKDKKEANRLYKLAADQGHAEAAKALNQGFLSSLFG